MRPPSSSRAYLGGAITPPDPPESKAVAWQRKGTRQQHITQTLVNGQSRTTGAFVLTRKRHPPRPRDALEWGGGTPAPARAPSQHPATVSLTPSASFNGICNRQ